MYVFSLCADSKRSEINLEVAFLYMDSEIKETRGKNIFSHYCSVKYILHQA